MFGQRRNLQRFTGDAHRPAGWSSTEMSKNVRFLDMVADGNAGGRAPCASGRRLADRHRKRTRGCDLREKKSAGSIYRPGAGGWSHPHLGHASLQDGHPRRCALSRRLSLPSLTTSDSSRRRREIRAHREVRRRRFPLQLRPHDRRSVSSLLPHCWEAGG